MDKKEVEFKYCERVKPSDLRIGDHVIADTERMGIVVGCTTEAVDVDHGADGIATYRARDENGMLDFLRRIPGVSKPPESPLQTQVGGEHYKSMAIEPWDAIKAWLTPEEYRGYQKGVAIAYLARENKKGGDQDILKAIHHLQKLASDFSN